MGKISFSEKQVSIKKEMKIQVPEIILTSKIQAHLIRNVQQLWKVNILDLITKIKMFPDQEHILHTRTIIRKKVKVFNSVEAWIINKDIHILKLDLELIIYQVHFLKENWEFFQKPIVIKKIKIF